MIAATNKKPQLRSFLVPIINHCLSSLQMNFKSFFWLVCSPSTHKKKKLHVGLQVVGQVFGIQLLHIPLRAPKTPKLWQGRKRSLPKPKILKQGCIANSLISILFQKMYFQRQLNWNDRYFGIRKSIPFDTHTHAGTHICT